MPHCLVRTSAAAGTTGNYCKLNWANLLFWVAKGYGPTGICTGRSGTGRTPNNLIIITGNSYNDSLVPIKESQLVYFLANQILGAFGAMADGAGDDGCDEFKETGNSQPQHYLMWPDVMRDTLITEERLSKCSKSDLITSLSSCRSSCFEVDLHPFCGNGSSFILLLVATSSLKIKFYFKIHDSDVSFQRCCGGR